jgi:hypothetical protein
MCNQESRDNEKNVDTHDTTGKPGKSQVERDDQGNGNGPQAINVQTNIGPNLVDFEPYLSGNKRKRTHLCSLSGARLELLSSLGDVDFGPAGIILNIGHSKTIKASLSFEQGVITGCLSLVNSRAD